VVSIIYPLTFNIFGPYCKEAKMFCDSCHSQNKSYTVFGCCYLWCVGRSWNRTLCSRTLLECDYITAVINHKYPADLQHWTKLVESTSMKPSHYHWHTLAITRVNSSTMQMMGLQMKQVDSICMANTQNVQ